MIWLLSAWGGFQRLLRLALSYPWQAALIVAVAASVWLYNGREAARDGLAKESAAHIATKVDYANAQKVAAEINKKQVARIESERREIANAKDSEIRSGIDRAVADARRMWAARAVESFTAGSAASETATSPVDPHGASGMSILDESDVRICTINTLKAKGWQDFYEGVHGAE